MEKDKQVENVIGGIVFAALLATVASPIALAAGALAVAGVGQSVWDSAAQGNKDRLGIEMQQLRLQEARERMSMMREMHAMRMDQMKASVSNASKMASEAKVAAYASASETSLGRQAMNYVRMTSSEAAGKPQQSAQERASINSSLNYAAYKQEQQKPVNEAKAAYYSKGQGVNVSSGQNRPVTSSGSIHQGEKKTDAVQGSKSPQADSRQQSVQPVQAPKTVSQGAGSSIQAAGNGNQASQPGRGPVVAQNQGSPSVTAQAQLSKTGDRSQVTKEGGAKQDSQQKQPSQLSKGQQAAADFKKQVKAPGGKSMARTASSGATKHEQKDSKGPVSQQQATAKPVSTTQQAAGQQTKQATANAGGPQQQNRGRRA